MELTPGMSALVTGGANGIGKAIGLALAKNGLFVTVVDFSEERGTETVSLLEKENKKFHPNIDHPSAMFIKCDVTNTGEVSAAFEKHVEIYGGLDICVNSAGVGTTVKRFDEDVYDGINTWRRIISINFVVVIDCTRIAIQTMRKTKKPGVIINLGSASGLYPMCVDPIYSASKGGVVLFTRSCSTLSREGIRVNVLCPEFVDTGIISENNLADVKMVGGYLPMKAVVEGAFELIKDESKAGACLWITNRRGTEYWPTPEEENKIWSNLVTKWHGKVCTKLPTTKPDQAWSLLKDFCNLHKYLPSLSVCEKVEGENEIPGCVRYCAGTMQPSGVNFWAKEKLISFDNTNRSYNYEVTESGIGVEGYVATLQVVEGGVDNNDGCKIEWSFEFKPLEGLSEAGYIEILQHWIKEMAKKVEDGLVMGSKGMTEGASSSTQNKSPKEDDYDFLKEGRKQTEVRLEKALARVKSMVQYPEARDQYSRLQNVVSRLQESKEMAMNEDTEDVGDAKEVGDADLMTGLEEILKEDSFMPFI